MCLLHSHLLKLITSFLLYNMTAIKPSLEVSLTNIPPVAVNFDLELDLYSIKMNQHTKCLGHCSEVIIWTHKQTDTHTHTHTPDRLLYLYH